LGEEEKRKSKHEIRKAKREERRQACVYLKLRSFGPARRGPQDDRLAYVAEAESGGALKLRVSKAPYSKKRPQA